MVGHSEWDMNAAHDDDLQFPLPGLATERTSNPLKQECEEKKYSIYKLPTRHPFILLVTANLLKNFSLFVASLSHKLFMNVIFFFRQW